MNYAQTLALVLMAVYGLTNFVLSIFVGALWRAWLEPKPLDSRILLGLRLTPCVGSLFLAALLALPAFLVREPNHAAEPVGPVLALMAAFSALIIGGGVVRGSRARAAAVGFLRECGPWGEPGMIAGRHVDIIDVPDGIVAVVGVWRPRILAATGVLEVCSGAEVAEIVGHEVAHISAHDNLKLLMIIASPDMLAWMPEGKALTSRWRAAVEFDADATATGADPFKRLALASALVKVARLSHPKRPLAELASPIAVDDVSGRVHRLLAPSAAPTQTLSLRIILTCVILAAIMAVPLHGFVQESIEALVAFGR